MPFPEAAGQRARPTDRCLVVGIGDGGEARELARAAVDGMVLGVDPSDDRVRGARKLSVERENLMFVAGSHERIPWQEEFFTLVVCREEAHDWARELYRVTAAGGRVYAPGAAEAAFRAAGFETKAGLILEARKP